MLRQIAALIIFLTASLAYASPIDAPTLEAVLSIADASGVPRSVARQLMIEESGDWRTGTLGDPLAIGAEGGGYKSRGLYQLHDKWVAGFVAEYWTGGTFDVMDPLDNATVALRYLAALHERYGNWTQALWFYNSGNWRRALVPARTIEYAERCINAR